MSTETGTGLRLPPPTLGRIVHYRSGDDNVSAAIITHVYEDNIRVDMTVFTRRAGLPCVVLHAVPMGESPETKDAWSWPPRV